MSIGSNPDAVTELLLNRAAGKPDSHRAALIIEGGSLRGVFSCGVCDALNVLNLHNTFDIVIGTSSGALNAMYLPGRQTATALSIYTENAIAKECLNLGKFPDVLNVKWLVDEWILKKKRYDDAAVANGRAEILVPATDALTGETVWFSSRNSAPHSFERALVATCLTPVACNEVEEIEGRRLSDGLVNTAIPVEKAIAMGATHIVAAVTRPWGYRKSPDGALLKHYARWRMSQFGDAYIRSFEQRYVSYNRSLDLLGAPGGAYSTLVVAPRSKRDIVGNLESRSAPITRSFEAGRDIALAAFARR